MEWRFPSRLEDLTSVATEVGSYLESAGIGGRAAYVANLALEELGTNILKYGYDDTAVHEILLRMEVQPGMVRLMLEDDGHPFNPLDLLEPDIHLPAEERVPGGLGIHLVRRMVDRMEYQRCDGLNRVTVEIHTSTGSPGAPAAPGQPGQEPLVSMKAFLRQQELAYLNRVIQQCGGNKEQAALQLGISVATMYRRLSADDREP